MRGKFRGHYQKLASIFHFRFISLNCFSFIGVWWPFKLKSKARKFPCSFSPCGRLFLGSVQPTMRHGRASFMWHINIAATRVVARFLARKNLAPARHFIACLAHTLAQLLSFHSVSFSLCFCPCASVPTTCHA